MSRQFKIITFVISFVTFLASLEYVKMSQFSVTSVLKKSFNFFKQIKKKVVTPNFLMI